MSAGAPRGPRGPPAPGPRPPGPWPPPRRVAAAAEPPPARAPPVAAGMIIVEGAVGEKLQFKTGDGTVDAKKLSGHEIFVLGKQDNAVLSVEEVRLESGDRNCKEGVEYKEGFPKTPEYATPVMVCEKVFGTLTIDSEGAENGGKPAVTVKEVYSGNLNVSVRVGNVEIEQTACTTFVGEYEIRTAAGKLGIGVQEATVGTYPLLLDGSAEDVKVERSAAEQRAITRPDEPFFFWDEYATESSKVKRGEICKGYAGVPAEPVINMTVKAVTTGNVSVKVNEAFLDKDGVLDPTN